MRRAKQEAASGCLLLMEECEQLPRYLERYRTLRGYTADEQAIAAIEQLMRDICEWLDWLETGDITRC